MVNSWMKIRYFLMVIPLLSMSCHSKETEPPTPEECRALVHSFFKMSHKVQLAAFPQLSLERQYVSYICGMRNIHPPTLYLAEAFAKEGKNSFPFLAKKMTETKNDATFRDILHVFGEMQRTKTYDVYAEKELLQVMNSRAAAMPDKFWRDYTQRLIGKISIPQ
jgi:hypothetical protein